ncbi:MAG: hypothetical protein H6R13_3047 [Proteobacteria bacterium]|nr:hypothetical protein [Pseudomonadota bacterium]
MKNMIKINCLHTTTHNNESTPIAMRPLLLLLHLAGIIIWVGGMYFAHFCLRPVATEQLQPAQRLPLMTAVLGRFFPAVAIAIIAILISGVGLMLIPGFARAPIYWHAMMGIGLLMTAIFGVIYLVHFRALKAAVATQAWPTAGAAMNRIRPLVATNLLLGGLTVVVATLGPLLG